MEFRQIRYALSVAKERSFTRASTRLNISQSAVSAQIRLLENEIGFPLFWRSTRGVELTDAGRSFLHEAERIAGDLLNLPRQRGDYGAAALKRLIWEWCREPRKPLCPVFSGIFPRLFRI